MTATVRSERLAHVAALDGLRGVAVAGVLLFHAGHLTGGWLGVDLFFVLSGYLITSLLLVGWRRAGALDLRGFWSRRVRRLGPALVVTLVAAGAYAATVALPSERLAIRGDGIATLLEVANWRAILADGDYWANQLRPSPLRHTWSLSIEEQLYLLWPLVVAGVLAWRKAPRAILVTALVLATASAGAMVGLHAGGASTARLYYGTDTRASAVMLGAALAALRLTAGRERWDATRRARHLIGPVAAVLLAAMWWHLDGAGTAPYRGLLPLAGLLGALAISSICDPEAPGPLGRALSLRPLCWLGLVSYGAYLYHWPLYLVLDTTRTGLEGWALTAVRIAATLLLAAVSHRFLEEPIRRGRWPRDRAARAAVPAGAALAVIALFVGTLGATPSPAALASAPLRVDRSATRGAPTVMFAGDSVSLLLGVTLSTQVDELGIDLANRAVPGCHLLASLGPIRGVEGDVRTDVADCAMGGEYARQVERIDPDVSVVLFGEFPNESVSLDGRWTMPCADTYLGALETRVRELVGDLRASGAPVVLLTAPGTSLDWVLERVPPGMDERVRCSNDVLRRIADDDPDVHVVDLAELVCPAAEEDCLLELDGADLRPDGLHFMDEGAAAVNRWLIPRVLDAAGLQPGT